ncbi:metabotropic glutamate receptor 3 isoform X2 [Parasteatoda tepidariorum]|uniref:metabotropic glutamate receptor 3 isoform X2 n=1 Tax=Parasteatoda tepidariorum TaxID=114398 RepID=UPI001C71E0B7|nr:metabotropic glutamate receptor 3 isoform X2 [Parasteatoda tepidariorum]
MANRTYLENSLSTIFQVANSTLSTLEKNCTSSSHSFQNRTESWVIPLVVICTLNVVAILIFEVYVLYKSCGGRRHLFLGQILLLGLLLSSLVGFAFVPTPNWFTCALTRTGVGIASVIVFATLLVKCVFLLSLHIGVYLSAAYQGLLLFFAVAVQIVIAVQWLIYRPASLVIVDQLTCNARCAAPSSDIVASLAYNMLLMLGVGILAVRARTVPENHHESRFIGIAITICIPLWVAWIVASSVSSIQHHDPCLAFGIVLTASIVFLVMFLPKARQLSVMGRNGFYTDDGFSSVNQSIYTPSFLHLKPPILPFVKQGTLVKPLTSSFPTHAERGYFVPPLQHASRLWRYSHHPATLQIQPPLHPSPEDIYLPNERYLFAPPAMKLYRSPLY